LLSFIGHFKFFKLSLQTDNPSENFFWKNEFQDYENS